MSFKSILSINNAIFIKWQKTKYKLNQSGFVTRFRNNQPSGDYCVLVSLHKL